MMARHPNRFGLAPLIALIAVLAVGLAAMKAATAPLATLSAFAASAALLAGTLGAILRRRRGAWVGFALFSWAYAVAGLGHEPLRSVAIELVDPAVAALHPEPGLLPTPLVEGVDTNFRTEGGRHYRLEGRAWVEVHLSPEEARAVDAYFGANFRHQAWSSSDKEARRIGLLFLGLTYASIGALAGQVLDDRSSAAVNPPGDEAPAMPG